ncbi:MAG: response regulator transcription factor [Actinomycetota bacterium]|jgi:DNA-binding response OmpR family regulator|nr:response regulator transcription factor [Actinomycetota bacterium]
MSAKQSQNVSPSSDWSPRLLLVEDDIELAASVAQYLTEKGLTVSVAHSFNEGKRLLDRGQFDSALIDVMLPGKSGLELCDYVSLHLPSLPVIMVTALSSEEDRLAGFDAGSDDYLVKPFSLAELYARLRVLIRRSSKPTLPLTFKAGQVTIDTLANIAKVGGVEVRLTNREIQIAQLLIRRSGFVVTRASILSEVWDVEEEIAANNVDQYVRRLRKKVFFEGSGCEIETIHGLGYRFRTIS